MYKLATTFAVLVSLSGCAALSPPEPVATAALVPAATTASATPSAEAAPARAAAAAVKTVDANELDQRTVCVDIKPLGSRIVRERRCYTPTDDPEAVARNDELVQQQMDQLRREQEALERMQREQELERQRAIIMMGVSR